MKDCRNSIPSERIRVFISSAQSNENWVAWRDVRQRIKDTLRQCVYLNPFIIEDEGSVTRSSQFFQRQVERTDVMVLLVKGEVRSGTATEYSLATKLNKPLLVYFIDDDNPNLDVIKLKRDIQTFDRCTFHQVTDFDDIEIKIHNDLMNNIIRAFQDTPYVSQLDNRSSIITEIHEDSVFNIASTPSKTEINKFNSCYKYFFDRLRLGDLQKNSEPAELHVFGCALLDWLITGKWEINDTEIIKFIMQFSDTFRNLDWLQKRWDAIRSYIKGDLEKALSDEEKALNLAREAHESYWIINDILIDCRNIEIEINSQNSKASLYGKYQEELSTQRMMVCLPITDRYLININDYIEKDEFREETATPYTELYGSNLSYAITDLANYLFSAAVYGSNTHMQFTRNVFIKIMNRYSEIIDDSTFAFTALRQYVLLGNAKEFKLYIKSSWDKQYTTIASKADEIWRITENVPITKRDATKQTAFTFLGLYMSDPIFAEATAYILKFSDSVQSHNSEIFFESILANIDRINANEVIRILIPIITERRFILGYKLSHIILYMDLCNVEEQNLEKLAIALKEQLPYIIDRNGDPQMISTLIDRSREIFGDLELLDGNGLHGLQEIIYKINLGYENTYSLLDAEINSARIQFEKNNAKGVFYGFSTNPYSMISAIVRKEKDNNKIDNLIINSFVPLAIDVLNSEASVQTKEPCVACLCDIISSFYKRNIQIPETLIQASQTIDVEKGTDIFLLNSRKAFEIRVLMLKIIAGITDTKSLFHWCIEFNNLDIREKIVVIDCLEKYLFYKKDSTEIDSLIISIVLQCSTEKHADIRRIAIRCLSYAIESKYRETLIIALNRAVYDPSSNVRGALLYLCEEKIIPNELSTSFTSLLSNDANYIIRKRALDYISTQSTM